MSNHGHHDHTDDQSAAGAAGAAGPTPSQVSADEDELQSALQGLSQLGASASLSESLTRIAEFAVRAIPGADGAGITMLEAGHAETVSTTAPFVAEIDDIQYRLAKQGPCITAATEARTVVSGALGDDGSWPRFSPRVRALGVHSVVSLPLIVRDDVLGAINVYAHAHNVFDEHAVRLGEAFAVPAAVAVSNARVLMQAQRLAAQLQTALGSRAVIDQAMGVVMSRQGCTAEEAFDRLRAISQSEGKRLSAVAASILEEAVRRARARHLRP